VKSERAGQTAGVVLVYHPPEDVIDNVERLLEQVSWVFVVDNSPGESVAVMERIGTIPRVTVLDQRGNVGVAAGFNAGMRAALDDGFDFVWIFDQDSTITEHMHQKLQDARRNAMVKVGIVGPALRAAETGRVYDNERGVGTVPREVLISSGALFSRQVLEAIGFHDEALFIDYVDHDISLRANRAGFTNLKVFDTLLDHRFGASEPTPFLGRRVYLSNYSPTRLYYSARNRLIVVRRHGGGPWLREDIRFTLRALTKMLIAERDRPQKVRAFLRGCRDGLRYKNAARGVSGHPEVLR
jgi:rhamnosyltransferase